MTTEISKGLVNGQQETLVNEIKGMVGSANKLLHEAGHSVTEEIAETRVAIGNKARGASAATDQYVRNNPWTIAGIAATAGLIIGALLSRR